jgi:Fe2+ or Zn2+ uptake regulation protein
MYFRADISFDPGVDLTSRVRDFTDFSVSGHNLEFAGLCQDCGRASENVSAAEAYTQG